MAGGDAQLFEVGGLLGQQNGHHANHHRILSTAPGQRFDGVHYRQEAVYANAHHQQDGAVHITIESGRDEAARGLPVSPVVAIEMVGHLEGKQQHKQQVSHCQVQHEDHCWLLGLYPACKHEDGKMDLICHRKYPTTKQITSQTWQCLKKTIQA
uniref:Uncharacterized protein n=1 Tax=Paramormyrops kingsleyae TaxID=1676925 RepID=A0A3B3SIJ4_9TELE